MTSTIFEFLSGIGVFLFALYLLNNSIVNSSDVKNLKMDKSPLLGIVCGCASSIVVQSSSAINSIAVQLSSKNVLKKNTAYYVSMGTNIGTTLTAYLALSNYIDLQVYLLGFIFISTISLMILKNKTAKRIAYFITCFILIFVGLHIIGNCADKLTETIDFYKIFSLNNFVIFLLATLITSIIQSSSLMSVLIVTFASAGIISLETGFFMIMGINVGTCSTPILASIGTNKTGLKVGMFNLVFNVIGVVLNLFLYYTGLLSFTVNANISVPLKIALFHTIFNVTTTLLFVIIMSIKEKPDRPILQ